MAIACLIIVNILIVEYKLLISGYAPDIYMFPFRFLAKKQRAKLQDMVDDVCAKINYREKIQVKIYFFPGLVMRVNLAFCIIPGRTIFIQNWLLKNMDHEMLYFVLCHELGHIVKKMPSVPDESLVGEYEADEFAASITGKDAAIAALQRTKELVKLLNKRKPLEYETLAAFELDSRIWHLKSLGNNLIFPPPSNAAP